MERRKKNVPHQSRHKTEKKKKAIEWMVKWEVKWAQKAEFEKAQQWAEVIKKKIIRIMSSYKY